MDSDDLSESQGCTMASLPLRVKEVNFEELAQTVVRPLGALHFLVSLKLGLNWQDRTLEFRDDLCVLVHISGSVEIEVVVHLAVLCRIRIGHRRVLKALGAGRCG